MAVFLAGSSRRRGRGYSGYPRPRGGRGGQWSGDNTDRRLRIQVLVTVQVLCVDRIVAFAFGASADKQDKGHREYVAGNNFWHMDGTSYRVPEYPVAPGEDVPKSAFRIIESMPVKSLITSPETGRTLASGENAVEVRGHAWAGDRGVAAVHVSRDFGATWQEAELSAAPNRYSWQRWRATVSFPSRGYYEVWARATDDTGVTQPFAIAWNPKGYLNNSMHRIALRVV